MVRMKTKFAAILAGVLVCLGIGITPCVSAYAEETANEPITSTETSVEKEESGVVVETPNTEENGEITGGFESEGETEDKTEVTIDLDNLTYEKFLEIVGVLAEETGNGDMWQETIESVNKAIDEKQLTASVITSIAVSVVMLLKIITDWISKKREKAHAATTAKLESTAQKQNAAVNELIDEEEKIAKELTENTAREKKIASAGLEQNAALRCLVRGVQLHETARDEALRHLNNSDSLYEEGQK